MKQRVLRMLPVLFVCSIAAVVLADKKTAAVAIRLVRLEGNKLDDIVLHPTDFTITRSVSWKKSAQPSNDEPTLEFTSGDPAELSCQLEFDTFDEKQNVYQKQIQPLESLLVVDQTLKRPPMVSVTFEPANASPGFKGVLSSVEAKYTLFLPDGTPVRATANVKLKQASSVSVSKNPCP
jgi:hypothetical protein